jgi:hypothetical protein
LEVPVDLLAGQMEDLQVVLVGHLVDPVVRLAAQVVE